MSNPSEDARERWEYYTDVHGEFEVQEHLDEFGRDGWELVTVLPAGTVTYDRVTQDKFRIFMKRRRA